MGEACILLGVDRRFSSCVMKFAGGKQGVAPLIHFGWETVDVGEVMFVCVVCIYFLFLCFNVHVCFWKLVLNVSFHFYLHHLYSALISPM